MTARMELEEERRAKEFVLEKLRKLKTARSALELASLAQRSKAGYSTQAIRRAIWYLVDEGAAEFTDDMRVVAHK